jgi:hypothetical protein
MVITHQVRHRQLDLGAACCDRLTGTNVGDVRRALAPGPL